MSARLNLNQSYADTHTTLCNVFNKCDPHYKTQIIENQNNLKLIDYVKNGAAQFVILLYFKSSKTDFNLDKDNMSK